MPERVRVASIDDVPPGHGHEVVAGGRIIALFNLEGAIQAIDGLCAHAGGPVARGRLQGAIVTCPWHGWQYDVTSGRSCLNPGICQQRFAVTVDGSEIFVELP